MSKNKKEIRDATQHVPTDKAVVVAKPVKVPKLKTGDDAQVTQTFKDLFDSAQNGLRAVIDFGLYAEYVKLTKLKHGQFGDWVKASLPDISYSSVRSHMQLATSVLEAAGYKSLKSFFKLPACCHFEKDGGLLTLPEKSCDEKSIELRSKVFPIVDGKSARQLFSEFKQAEEDDEGVPQKKRGRMKGQGGASAEQRAKAKQLEDEALTEALNLKAEEFIEWLDEHCDDKSFGQRLTDKNKAKLLERFELGASYLRKFNHKDTKDTKL